MANLYHIITYGCQMNEHDSENIAGLLEAMGYEYADDAYEADIVVMNTCSIRENADKRFFGVLGQFKKLKKTNPDFILCVCGCMPQQPRVIEEIKKSFAWVDVIFGTQNIKQFPELLDARIRTGRKQMAIIDNNPVVEEDMEPKRVFRHKALVNITYGCNNFCTYCIVPYTRGREKSRTIKDVKCEVERLCADGVKEVMLLGQNVDSFKDAATGGTFADLLRELDTVDGLERIRFMTSHPKDISDDMISCYQTCSKLCHNIHLPVQCGNDRVLKRMNRHYDRARYLDRVAKLREVCPDITISTDIIVGFPGETEEEFEDTLSLCKEVRYDSAFTFIYSPREGTPAARFEDQIPEEIKHARFDRLVDCINEISLEKNKCYVGGTYDVLVEGISKNDDCIYSGRTDGFKLVNFTVPEGIALTDGTIVKVQITDAKTFSLEGRLI
ncbi:MAG: tRNA (N6-isopentenyl adenosine(37)-C2)-methylthiotransferase MiaB [Clostridiales bacterium]|nr:tRNA (N6-isopentenyl adenosine(37)-C2)-methylthiotransferase MiaB [Candidatus Crickella merdequi]